jgi:hypothetical protein
MRWLWNAAKGTARDRIAGTARESQMRAAYAAASNGPFDWPAIGRIVHGRAMASQAVATTPTTSHPRPLVVTSSSSTVGVYRRR